uniref:Uncharacterized protein n=1 Tax=Avena sativa TaxID=4498 RepID=A0ACD5ZJR6_AVESA
MEDNNLWKRHLLNLVTQVVLALYVFWKSIGKHSANLLLAGSFVFVAGIIKYVERTWALKSGSQKSIESSDRYKIKGTDDKISEKEEEEVSEEEEGTDTYHSKLVDGLLQDSLDSMADVFQFLSDRSLLNPERIKIRKRRQIVPEIERTIWKASVQLGMIYDDVYTKSFVLRTWTGAILRCISQAAVIVAFVLFHVSDKVTYGKADIAITYSLFVGCLFLEVCSMVVSMMSPWTWAWFKNKNCGALASFFRFVLRCEIGYPEMKQRWPNLIGQYSMYSWLFDKDQQRRKYSQRIMILLRKLFVGLFHVGKKKLFWMSKLLDAEYMDLDSRILRRVVQEIRDLPFGFKIDEPSEWKNIGNLLKQTHKRFVVDFGQYIAELHLYTERFLEKCASSKSYMKKISSDEDLVLMDEVCSKLSKYMMYLLVTQPSLLPLSISAGATLNIHQLPTDDIESDTESSRYDVFNLDPTNESSEPHESSKELARMWMRLLIYAAGKSRTALHVAQLGRGGELITFLWLVMSHSGIGESHGTRIQLTQNDAGAENRAGVTKLYGFIFPSEDQKLGADSWWSESEIERPRKRKRNTTDE